MRKVRPLVLQACDHLSTFPRFLRHAQSIDVSTEALFEQNYPRICRELGGILRDETAFSDKTKLPPVLPLPDRNRMRYYSLGEKFVGRVEAIWQLHDSLFRDSTTILQGVVARTRGLGKTQLAIEYAHRFGAAYTGGVYWVDADRGLGTLVTQVSSAAGIDIDTKAEEPAQVEQLWQELNRRHKPCLLVLDNFPENVPLRPYLPTAGPVHTIVTTRRQDKEMDILGEMESLNEFAAECRDELPSRHELDVVCTFQMSWNLRAGLSQTRPSRHRRTRSCARAPQVAAYHLESARRAGPRRTQQKHQRAGEIIPGRTRYNQRSRRPSAHPCFRTPPKPCGRCIVLCCLP
jgi:hypothetical protein